MKNFTIILILSFLLINVYCETKRLHEREYYEKEFDSFMKKYNKVYSTEEEKEYFIYLINFII